MTFRGSLTELPLADVIQLIAVSGKTGMFDLTQGDATGQIYLLDGQIVHAEVEDLEGEEAIFEFVTWTEGSFLFTPERESATTTITKSNDNLLVAAAHRLDEWAVLKERVISTELVPTLCPGTKPANQLSSDLWAVICAIDGRRTITEIALALDKSLLETCRAIYDLVSKQVALLQDDPLDGHRELLGTLSREQAAGLLDSCDALARSALGDDQDLDRFPDLDRNLTLCREELRRGRELDAVCDLVRGHGRTLYAAAGAETLESYLQDVEQILSRALA